MIIWNFVCPDGRAPAPQRVFKDFVETPSSRYAGRLVCPEGRWLQFHVVSNPGRVTVYQNPHHEDSGTYQLWGFESQFPDPPVRLLSGQYVSRRTLDVASLVYARQMDSQLLHSRSPNVDHPHRCIFFGTCLLQHKCFTLRCLSGHIILPNRSS